MISPRFGEAEYLCYQVIKQVRKQYGKQWDLPKIMFHNLCYSVDMELRDEDIDIELPVHWDRHGGVVVDDAISSGIHEFVERNLKGNRGDNVVSYQNIDEDNFEIDGERAAQIKNKVKNTVKESRGHHDISILQDYQYEEYAPNDFVRILDEYRDILEELNEPVTTADMCDVAKPFEDFDPLMSQDSAPSPSEDTADSIKTTDLAPSPSEDTANSIKTTELVSPSEDTKAEIRDYLDQLIVEYPGDQYSQMEDQFLEWENLSLQMVQNDLYSHLYEFMNSFLKTFSRVELRIKHNRNVPVQTQSQWKQRIPQEMEAFQDDIEAYRSVVLENREQTEVLDMVADSYSDTVREMFDQPSQDEQWGT